MTAYCEPNDLLIGDIGGLEDAKQRAIDSASEDIDAQIGFIYEIPLSGQSSHITLLLKGICKKLASGRLLMAQAAASEDNSVHQYGKSLLDEAVRELWSIRNGQIELGAVKVTQKQTTGNAPTIIQGDAVSGVDAYYDWFNHPLRIPLVPFQPIWKPGNG